MNSWLHEREVLLADSYWYCMAGWATVNERGLLLLLQTGEREEPTANWIRWITRPSRAPD